MKIGALLMPSHPLERLIRNANCSECAEPVRLDRLSFDEAWIGEHFWAAWEPGPAPAPSWTVHPLRWPSVASGPNKDAKLAEHANRWRWRPKCHER